MEETLGFRSSTLNARSRQEGAHPIRRRPSRTKALRAFSALAIGALLLSGCHSQSLSDSSASSGPQGSPAIGEGSDPGLWSTEAEFRSATPESIGGSSGLSSAQNPSVSAENQIGDSALTGAYLTREAMLTLATPDPGAATDQVHTIVKQQGGVIDSQTLQAATDYSGASASFTIRVPAAGLNKAVEALSTLGAPVSLQTTTNDVTTYYVDTEARLDSLRASVAQLEQLREAATSTSDLLEAESALSARQAELAGLEAQLSALQDQVEQATLWLTLETPAMSPATTGGGFWGDILRGLQSILSATVGLISLIGFLIPWALLLALIASLIVFVRRIRRKRNPAGGTRKGRGGPAPFVPQQGQSTPPTTNDAIKQSAGNQASAPEREQSSVHHNPSSPLTKDGNPAGQALRQESPSDESPSTQ